MDLHIYTPSFEYLGCVDAYTSFRWRRQLFDTGEVDLHCIATAPLMRLLQSDNYILLEGKKEFAILDGCVIKSDSDGESIDVTGRLGNALFDRCVIDKTYNFNGSVEDAMRQLVADQMHRICPITLGEKHGYTETIHAQITHKNLLSTLFALAKASSIFFRLCADVPNKRLVFDTFKGMDRTVLQKQNPRVVFSDLEDTIGSSQYSHNKKKYRNFAYVGGEGEGDDRIIVTVNRCVPGETRRELFVDAKDLRKKELSTTEYEKLLMQRGNQKLDSLPDIQNFETAIRPDNEYIYGQDWDLGDKVTCHKNAWGIMVDERVTEVEEVYEGNTIGDITPTLGAPFPEKFDLGE